MSDIDDTMSVVNYGPEVLAGLIVGTTYGVLMYQWAQDGLGVTGEFILFSTVLVALITVFGVDRLEKAVGILRGD